MIRVVHVAVLVYKPAGPTAGRQLYDQMNLPIHKLCPQALAFLSVMFPRIVRSRLTGQVRSDLNPDKLPNVRLSYLRISERYG